MNDNLKIGITERGDAGLDLSWTEKMNTINGAILITKNITPAFVDAVLGQDKPIIVHCTCTGYGGSPLEPNVPVYNKQLQNLTRLIKEGFPAERCVLRIDPIFPSEKGLKRAGEILQCYYRHIYPLGVTRVRFSIVDEYPHIRQRYKERGWNPLYDGNFSANRQQIQNTVHLLERYYTKYPFESCGEAYLPESKTIEKVGCISIKDLKLMDIPIPESMSVNPQNRKGCMCLSCKTELLTKRHPCPNGCVYCYWKN